MNILLDLFLTFFKIGLFSFGGGYAMIPLIQQEMVSHSWLTDSQIANIIAISESTPGPIAVNMATYIGSTQAGFLGSLLATLGVILPSIIVILLICICFHNFKNNKYVKYSLKYVRPTIIALIISVGLLLVIKCIYTNFGDFSTNVNIDIIALIIGVVCAVVYIILPKLTKKKISPIIIILLSAILGMILY